MMGQVVTFCNPNFVVTPNLLKFIKMFWTRVIS